MRRSLVAILMLVGGCTTVTIVSPNDGRVIQTSRFMAVGVSIEDSANSTTARVSGVGVVSTPGGVSIGAHTADLTFLGAMDCRAVLWFASADEAMKAKALFDYTDDICVAATSN